MAGAGGPGMMGFGGGDRLENLRNQLNRMRMFAGAGGVDQAQLDNLQTMYPGYNVTELYNNPTMQMMMGGGDAGEMGEEGGYWYNGTYYMGRPGMGMEDGVWYNGTWYPEGPDLEDGFYYNGTFYPGQEEGM